MSHILKNVRYQISALISVSICTNRICKIRLRKECELGVQESSQKEGTGNLIAVKVTPQRFNETGFL